MTPISARVDPHLLSHQFFLARHSPQQMPFAQYCFARRVVPPTLLYWNWRPTLPFMGVETKNSHDPPSAQSQCGRARGDTMHRKSFNCIQRRKHSPRHGTLEEDCCTYIYSQSPNPLVSKGRFQGK